MGFLNVLAKRAYYSALRRGFYEEKNDYKILCDISEEMTEVYDALKSDESQSEKIKGFTKLEEEISDVIISIVGLSYSKGCRIHEAVLAKMRYEETRKD